MSPARFASLPARDARALALGALVLVSVLAYKFAAAPAWRAVVASHAQVARGREALRHDRELVQRTADLQSRYASASAWLAREARRLFSRDELAATSELTDYVADAAAESGVRLRQSETRPSVAVTGPLRAVRLDVRAEGESRAVMRFLHTLESGDRLVRVGQLTMSRRAGDVPSGRPGKPGAPGAGPQMLSLAAQLYGYALVPPPAGVRVLASERGAVYVPLAGRGVTSAEIDDALARDPFSPARGAPPLVPVAAAPPPVRLVGTVVGRAGGDFAVCQVGDGSPTVVRPGESIAGLTLRTVTQGGALLAGPGGEAVRLTIPAPGA